MSNENYPYFFTQRVGDLTYHSGYTWKAEAVDDLGGKVKELTAASTADANLWVYMAKDPYFYGIVGAAYIGTMCKGWEPYGITASISEKRSNVISTAEVVTHEMGHNMGKSCKILYLNLQIFLITHSV